ncbi:hypothetical protein PCL_11446 [Purpureocillium lilacinum]|uniref:Uncharacterized protein n=1 Tax=Purpureocillium lilacinum TaxID=33203 RepID=A0A2U3EA33_PURLI|nr:hypothetical protein Purlil1_2708 [Purpureocillium lilacinum]PWI71352.1 hypothetical protein PCL_11446 [Purpureocillium lilacinum]
MFQSAPAAISHHPPSPTVRQGGKLQMPTEARVQRTRPPSNQRAAPHVASASGGSRPLQMPVTRAAMNRYVLLQPRPAACPCGACPSPLPAYAATDPNPAPTYLQATQPSLSLSPSPELRGHERDDRRRRPNRRLARWWKRVAGAMTFDEEHQAQPQRR